MAGTIGGGGGGDLALTYGYQRFNNTLMFVTVIILIIFVQLIQTLGNHLSKKIRTHEQGKKNEKENIEFIISVGFCFGRMQP